MPIKPENRHYYGKAWRTEIRPRILARASVPAGDLDIGEAETVPRCECVTECGQAHAGGRCDEVDRRQARTFAGKVILTVAHLDQDPAHNADDNLRALCQGCHNRVDARPRAAHARVTRGLKRHRALVVHGQQFMFSLEGA